MVTRKRQPNLKPAKDKVQATHLGSPNLGQRESHDTNPFISTLGPIKFRTSSKEGKRKPITIPNSNVIRADLTIEPMSSEKLRLVLSTLNDKSLAQSLKTRKKGRELPTWKGNNKKSPLVWKEVGVNPFGLNTQGYLDFPMLEIKEFKAGGSTNTKVVEDGPSLEKEAAKRIGGVNQGIWLEI